MPGLNHEKTLLLGHGSRDFGAVRAPGPVFKQIVNSLLLASPPLGESTSANTENNENLRDFDNQTRCSTDSVGSGVKTGSTPYAKYCLVASGTIEGVS